VKSRRKKSVRLILIILLVIVSSLLTVILYLYPILKHSYADNKIKKIYFAENITPAHSYLIKEFNKANNGKIEVIAINLPYEKFTTNKRKELITKNLRNRTSRIDIYAIDAIWGKRFNKWAEPLNSYFSSAEMKKIIWQAKKYCFSDSTLYSVPFFLDVGVLYYREDLLKDNMHYNKIINELRAGITWQRIINLNFAKQKYKYLFQADNYEGLMCNFLEIVGDNTFTYSKNGDFIFNAKVVERLNFVRDLIYKKEIVPEVVTAFNENKTFQFALENDVPFFRGWPSGKENIIITDKILPKIKHLKFAPLPRFVNDKSASTIGGWNLIVSKNSKYKNESIQFIKYLLSQSSQKYLFEKNKYLPVLKYFYSDSSYLKKNPELNLFYKLIQNGVFRIKHSRYTKISDIITFNLNLFFMNKISANEFVSNSQKEINYLKQEY